MTEIKKDNIFQLKKKDLGINGTTTAAAAFTVVNDNSIYVQKIGGKSLSASF